MIKKIVFFVLILLSFSIQAQTKKKKKLIKKVTPSTISFIVKGTITETQQYCGGAPPQEDMLKELNTPKPIANYKLYIRKFANNISTPIYKTIVTDSLGRYSIKLELGTYSVVDSRKKDKQTYLDLIRKYKSATKSTGPIDENCLKMHFAQADFMIDVTPEPDKIIDFNYFRTCDYTGAPCVEFTGPMPQ